MTSNSRTPVLTSELMASREPFRDRVYMVGPYAGRVSFSSQQRRAISLVCDIDRDIKASGDVLGLEGKEIAIIGGGVAGLTCAAMVAALGAGAWVYEEKIKLGEPEGEDKVACDEVMPTIRDASHRDAHPTLNFWPHENIEPITRLPFLNWHEADCVSVSKRILREFNDIMRDRVLNQRVSIRTGHLVKEVKPGWTEGKWQLECEYHADAAVRRRRSQYDVVILAVGFGEEKIISASGTSSYWRPENDPVPVIWERPPEGIDHYVVSGTGDGGLIEALRLVFRNLRAGNLDGVIAGALEDLRVRNGIARIENKAHKFVADHVLHGEGKQPSREVRDELSDFLWKSYTELLESIIGDSVFTALGQMRSSVKRVELIGEWTFPMELSASPYHRVLVALAEGQGWLRYHQSKSIHATALDAVEVRTGRLRARIPRANLQVELKAAGGLNKIDFPNSYYVSRHGYTSPIESLYPGNTKLIEQIQRQQALYADQDSLSSERARMVAGMFQRPDPADTGEFLKANFEMLWDYFGERFGVSLARPAKPDQVFLELHGAPGRRPDPTLPKSLWGLELRRVFEAYPTRLVPDSGVDTTRPGEGT